MLGIVSLPSIFQFAVESGLHLGLLEEHLLSDFVDLFLVFDLHCIADASDLFSGLCKVTLQLFPVSLTFV